MTRNAYIDESQRPGLYVMAAAVIEHAHVQQARRTLRGVHTRGRPRGHFHRESDMSRRRMLSEFGSIPGLTVVAGVVRDRAPAMDQRARCLRLLVDELLDEDVERIVLDHIDPAQRRRDRQVLEAVVGGGVATYEHDVEQTRELFLVVADAVAWCVGRREWRPRLGGWVRIVAA